MVHAALTKVLSLALVTGILFSLSFVQPVGIGLPAVDLYWTLHDKRDMAKFNLVQAKEIACMTRTIFFEAANQPIAGQMAVAFVIKNRAIKQHMSICDVVHMYKAFSCYWDGRAKKPIDMRKAYNQDAWWQINSLAIAVILHYNRLVDFTEGATYFHSTKVKPKWQKLYHKTVAIGDHIFYREK